VPFHEERLPDGRWVLGGKLMAVPSRLSPALEFGSPRELFSGLEAAAVGIAVSYTPTNGGKRFLAKEDGDSPRGSITWVMNWKTQASDTRQPSVAMIPGLEDSGRSRLWTSSQVRWRRDGKEIVYRAQPGMSFA
jgi:hypothetical protein